MEPDEAYAAPRSLVRAPRADVLVAGRPVQTPALCTPQERPLVLPARDGTRHPEVIEARFRPG